MATYIARYKAVIANIKNKDQTVPADGVLRAVADAQIRQYPTQWTETLASVGYVTNPATTDPLDIGTMSGETFTPDVTNLDKYRALHGIRNLRKHLRDIYIADQLKVDTAVAGDVGSTPSEVADRIKTDANTSADTNIGDPDNDPEV